MRELRYYQKKALRYTGRVDHPALFMEMRLGKTIVTIRAIKGYPLEESRLVLIVCPYSAMWGWTNELRLEKAKPIRHLVGSRDRRRKILEKASRPVSVPQYFIINKEGHRSLPEVADVPWNVVVLDESPCIKAPRSQVAEFFTTNFREANHRFILSGLPAPESDLDYFNQLQFLDPEIFVEQSYYQFRFANFGQIGHEWMTSPKGASYISRRLAKNCFFLSRHNVRLGGIKIYERRMIQMPKDLREIYETLEKEWVLEYLDARHQTMFATTKYIWLRRLCGGFADKKLISQKKAQELLWLLKNEFGDKQLAVYARFRAELEFLEAYLTENGYTVGKIHGGVKQKERDAINKSFLAGKVQIIVAQPEAVKYGRDFSCADISVFYSSPDGLDTRQQVEDRIVSTKSNDSNLIIDLVMEKSVEEKVLKSLSKKESRSTMMKNIVRELQRKYGVGGDYAVRSLG